MNSKVMRLLKIYDKLNDGEQLDRNNLAESFQVDERTIRRDINTINDYIDYFKIENKKVIKIKNEKKYELENKKRISKVVLLLLKIILDSRAFNLEEKNLILNELLKRVGTEDRKFINKFIRNENYNYVELEHKSNIIDKIWDLTYFINEQKIINIKYKRSDGKRVNRSLSPLGIVFSEFYFYLLANYENSDTTIVLRVDRIEDINDTNRKYKVNYKDRFKEGEFKKRVQFMYSGEYNRVQFEFEGGNIEAVKDRLPTSKVRIIGDNKYLVTTEVIGDGIIMWLLSQGSKIKVLEPKRLVEKIATEIKNMNEKYNF